jgi:hypothetical protein
MRITNIRLIILAVVTAGLFCWALLQAHFSRVEDTLTVQRYLFQGLDENQIHSIRITGQGKEPVILHRMTEGRFGVEALDFYPAQEQVITDLLVGIQMLRPVEMVTRSEKNHAELNVSPETADVVVELLDNEEKLLAGLVTGSSASPPDPMTGVARDAYVRRLSESAVYRVENVPPIQTDALGYVQTRLMPNLTSSRIERIAFLNEQGQFVLERKQGRFVPQDVPEGKEPRQESIEPLVGDLVSLEFEGVLDSQSGQVPADLSPRRQINLYTTNDIVYFLQILASGDQSYLAIGARETTQADGESEEDLSPAQAQFQADMRQFQERHAGWLYKLDPARVESLMVNREDLLADVEPEEQAAQPGDSDGAAPDSGTDAEENPSGQAQPAGGAEAQPDPPGEGEQSGTPDATETSQADAPDSEPAAEVPADNNEGAEETGPARE